MPACCPERVLRRSPFVQFYAAHPDDGAAAAEAAAGAAAVWDRKTTLLFFHGAICWQTYDHVDGLKGLDRKCKRQVTGGSLSAPPPPSSTHRAPPLAHFRTASSTTIRSECATRCTAATTPSQGSSCARPTSGPGPPRANLDDEVLAATFCLCPSGTGWGMRAYHAAALGCLPVLIQQDEKQTHPQVCASRLASRRFHRRPSYRPAHPAGPAGVRGTVARLGRLRRAAAVLLDQRPAVHPARAGGERHRAQGEAARAGGGDPRLLWRVATPSPAREAFANTEDAFSSVMATLAMRRAHGLRGEQ